MGEAALEVKAQVGVTLFYILLLLAGFPGNLMTCIIILYNSNMMSPTNCFLLNLAIVDLMTLITGKCLKNIFKKNDIKKHSKISYYFFKICGLFSVFWLI